MAVSIQNSTLCIPNAQRHFQDVADIIDDSCYFFFINKPFKVYFIHSNYPHLLE